jgi:hypothetical protein
MRNYLGFMLACVLFFPFGGWCQNDSDSASVRRIVLRYCQLDAEGALIDSGKSLEVRKYISNDVVIRDFPMIVIKGFSVEYLNVANDAATVVINYEFFGELMGNLVYKPIADLREKRVGQPATGNLQVEFRLRRVGAGASGWVISSCGSGLHVSIDNAILYLKKEHNGSSTPANRSNAEEALRLLQADLHR